MQFSVIRATIGHLSDVASLFDAYRVFYKQPSDQKAAQDFLKERFSNNDSVIFLVLDGNTPVGFTQLYKTFSSVSMQPFYILNDLFVQPAYRGKGAGELLLEKAKEFCDELGYKGLALETAVDNPAQKLYEKLGWKKEVDFLHYFWKASNT